VDVTSTLLCGIRDWFRSINNRRYDVQDLIYGDHLEPEALKRETEAEDDVVCACHPDGAIRLEDAARLLQPPDVEPVIPREAYRANRVTTPTPALPGAFGG